MKIKTLDSSSLEMRSFDHIAIDDSRDIVSLIGKGRKGAKAILFDSDWTIIHSMDAGDASKSIFSADGRTLVFNGSDAKLLFLEQLKCEPLKQFRQNQVFDCQFLGSSDVLLLWTSRPEIAAVKIGSDLKQIRCFDIPADAAMLESWTIGADAYVSSWRESEGRGEYAIQRLSDGSTFISTSKFRSPPRIVPKSWNAIVDSGVFGHDARVENLISEETELFFPVVSQSIPIVVPGTEGDLVLRHGLAMRDTLPQHIQAWSLAAHEMCCDVHAGVGRAMLCNRDSLIASTEISESGSQLRLHSVKDGSLQECFQFDRKFLYMSCSNRSSKVLLVNDQFGLATHAAIVDLQ